MAGLGEKTPVSFLQEYLISKQMLPRYELIYDGVGTHNPTFIYRVRAGEHSEEGKGRSKREAKHKAAEAMLKRLKIIDTAAEEEENEGVRDAGENYVGELKEVCFNQCYPAPRYYLGERAGPPHSRIFKIVCCVSQLQDHGISTTIKQAKQLAASKMLQRLKELKGNSVQDPSNKEGENPDLMPALKPKKFEEIDKEVIKKYNATKSNPSIFQKKDAVALYKDHHKAYLDLPSMSVTLSKLLTNPEFNNANAPSLVDSIAQELEVTLTTSNIPTVEGNKKFIVITMSVFPAFSSIGYTPGEAAINFLNSLLFMCKD